MVTEQTGAAERSERGRGAGTVFEKLERKAQREEEEMKEYGIDVGKANAVFKQIESDEYSEDEKLRSILVVLDMPTHNGITKDTILKAFRWLFEYAVEVDKE